jgi:hypothetical protein
MFASEISCPVLNIAKRVHDSIKSAGSGNGNTFLKKNETFFCKENLNLSAKSTLRSLGSQLAWVDKDLIRTYPELQNFLDFIPKLDNDKLNTFREDNRERIFNLFSKLDSLFRTKFNVHNNDELNFNALKENQEICIDKSGNNNTLKFGDNLRSSFNLGTLSRFEFCDEIKEDKQKSAIDFVNNKLVPFLNILDKFLNSNKDNCLDNLDELYNQLKKDPNIFKKFLGNIIYKNKKLNSLGDLARSVITKLKLENTEEFYKFVSQKVIEKGKIDIQYFQEIFGLLSSNIKEITRSKHHDKQTQFLGQILDNQQLLKDFLKVLKTGNKKYTNFNLKLSSKVKNSEEWVIFLLGDIHHKNIETMNNENMRYRVRYNSVKEYLNNLEI